MKDMAKDIGINWEQARLVTLETATINWMKARKKYYSTKHLHAIWRIDFQNSLIDALAKEEHLPREGIKKRMKREENQRTLGRKATRIRGKGINSPVFRALTTDKNGEAIEYNTQSSMVPIITESIKIC